MNIFKWNVVAILKFLWDVARKKDCLWIQYGHNYYMKKRYTNHTNTQEYILGGEENFYMT